MLKFKEFLNEKRSNPELNPRMSAYEEIKPYSKLEDYYISFTAIDKLGQNPQSIWKTPAGIYGFQIKQTWKEYNVEETKDFSGYPFAQDEPYIWIFKPKNPDKVLECSKYTEKQLNKDLEKLSSIFGSKLIDKVHDEINNTLNIGTDDTKANYTSGGMYADIIWRITRNLANNNIYKWNSIFSQLGYEGISDKKGLKIIHPNEPIQGIIFNRKDLIVVKEIYNKPFIKDISDIKTVKDLVFVNMENIFNNKLIWKDLTTYKLMRQYFINSHDEIFKKFVYEYVQKKNAKEFRLINPKNKPLLSTILIIMSTFDITDNSNSIYNNIINSINFNYEIFKENGLLNKTTDFIDSFDSLYNSKFTDKQLKQIENNLSVIRKWNGEIEKEKLVTDEELELLKRYKDTIFAPKDYLKLDTTERSKIKYVFNSEFRFLGLLNDLRDGYI